METGHIPARFQIQILILNFLKYILGQNKESLIFRFFKAQCQMSTKGDWISNIKKIIEDIDLSMTFEDISHMKPHIFKKISHSGDTESLAVCG